MPFRRLKWPRLRRVVRGCGRGSVRAVPTHRPAVASHEIGLGEDAVAGDVLEKAGDEGEAVVLSGRRHDIHGAQEGVGQKGIAVVIVSVERGA